MAGTEARACNRCVLQVWEETLRDAGAEDKIVCRRSALCAEDAGHERLCQREVGEVDQEGDPLDASGSLYAGGLKDVEATTDGPLRWVKAHGRPGLVVAEGPTTRAGSSRSSVSGTLR